MKTDMKTKLIPLVLVGTCLPLSAQVFVNDEVSHFISRINHAKEMAQYVEMVNNQLEHINTLNSQLNEITTYVDRFGDPEALLEITGVDDVVGSLNQVGVGKTLDELRELSDGAQAFQYTASGLYEEITQISASGIEVTRDPQNYQEFAAVQESSENFTRVQQDVMTRRTALKDAIAESTTALQASTTDAETQKLTGTLIAQSAELEAIDREMNFAAFQAILQDIDNRNDGSRQSEATAENLAADKNDALQKMSSLMVPDSESKLRFGGTGN
jgi:hypothetical protein